VHWPVPKTAKTESDTCGAQILKQQHALQDPWQKPATAVTCHVMSAAQYIVVMCLALIDGLCRCMRHAAQSLKKTRAGHMPMLRLYTIPTSNPRDVRDGAVVPFERFWLLLVSATLLFRLFFLPFGSARAFQNAASLCRIFCQRDVRLWQRAHLEAW
jgi:hypothetical protein